MNKEKIEAFYQPETISNLFLLENRMNWIYLWKGTAKAIASGVKDETVYAIAQNQADAINKCNVVISGNYKVKQMKIIAELADFGVEVFCLEDM